MSQLTLNEESFWSILDLVKESNEPEAEVKKELKKLDPNQIVAYQEYFDSCFEDAYKWDLWGAAYIIQGGCSDDGFIDFRYGLIAKGKDVYEKAIADPDSLADLEDADIANESFGYAALDVYEEKTGKNIPRKHIEISAEPRGEEWDFDDEGENMRYLPNLWKKYGER